MSKPVATNKKAYHNYRLSQNWEAGIALTGSEVKSIRAGDVNFTDSFARVQDGEVFLHNLHIAPYGQASFAEKEPDRVRKLLLHRREIKKIKTYLVERGLTLVPTKIYFNNRGLAKVEIALASGKKEYDKREDIKKRSIDLALKRTLKTRRT